jgi:hypothetical protein
LAPEPTRETEIPTKIAEGMARLNKSSSKNICPSVIDILFVGIEADTSPARVYMNGKAVRDPLSFSSFILAARSKSWECKSKIAHGMPLSQQGF